MELVAVNVGTPREVRYGDRMIETSIWKHPVTGHVRLADDHVEGDVQADSRNHGGPDMAVLAYALEDTEWWERELGCELGPGTFGENLSTRGLDVSGARIGERWAIGGALLEVRQPRIPCAKLGIRMKDPAFPKRFVAAGRPGALLAIAREGEVGAGDRIEVVARPDHEITVALVAHVRQRAPERAAELLAADGLSAWLREWAERRVGREPSAGEGSAP